MISEAMRQYPDVAGAWVSPEIVIVVTSVAWIYILGWIVIWLASKDDDQK